MRSDGKMLSGCIVRHLIMPLAAYDSVNIVKYVAGLKKDVYFSLMSQYTPYGDIEKLPELKRRITKREYMRVYDEVISSGLKYVYVQDFDSAQTEFIPRWDY